MSPTEEAAAIFIRMFSALARLHGKSLSAAMKDDLCRACELLGCAGDELDDLFEDIPAPRRSPGEQAIDDPRFEAWRARRAVEG